MLRPPDTAATPKPALVPSAPTRGAPGLALGASRWIEPFPCPSWSCPNIVDSPEGLSPARESRLPPHPAGDSSRDSGTAFLSSRTPNFGTERAVCPGILFWEPAWTSSIPTHPQGAEMSPSGATGPLCHPMPWQEKGFPSTAARRGGKGWRGNAVTPGNPFPAQQQPLPAPQPQSRSSGNVAEPAERAPNAASDGTDPGGVSRIQTVLSIRISKSLNPLFSWKVMIPIPLQRARTLPTQLSRPFPCGSYGKSSPPIPHSSMPGLCRPTTLEPLGAPRPPQNEIPGEQNRHHPTTSLRKGFST